MSSIDLLSIVNSISGDNDDKRQEISTVIYRRIQEGLISSIYSSIMWGKAVVYDVTFRGFSWLENN